jgi:CRISPR-associated protein Cmr3
MSKTTLKITPLDGYYFGSENRKPDDDSVNYFLKSLYMPQQSTLLGFVRYVFLKFIADGNIFKDNKIQDKEKAKDLIGGESFNIEGIKFNFEKIKSISEVFLLHGEIVYLPAPFDFNLGELEFKFNIPNYPHHNGKNYYPKNFSNSKVEKELKKIFIEVIQPGNKKDKKQDDNEDDAYYKQQYYRLKKGWSFGLEIESDKEIIEKLPNTFYINMGGENKLFKIEKTEINFNSEDILNKYAHSVYHKIILTSDAIIKDFANAYENCLFAFSKTKPFRNLISKVDKTEKYQNRTKEKKNNESIETSDLYELLESGSVFYFENKLKTIEFENKIKNKYLNKSGMNKYVIIEPNK